MNLPGIFVGKGHMCPHGVTLKDKHGDGLVLKATGWMTNSSHIYNSVCKLCSNDGSENDHRHVNLQSGVAAKAAIYQEGLCLAILRGLRRELNESGIMHINQIGTVCEDLSEYEQYERDNHDFVYYDDVSGQSLPSSLVKAARLEEKQGVM